MRRSTVVIGLGNPLLSDDGAGARTTELLEAILRERGIEDVSVALSFSGGLDLAEKMLGHSQAFVVDAMKTGLYPPGTAMLLNPMAALSGTLNTTSSHSSSLAIALEATREMSLGVPDSIKLIGIEADNIKTFRQGLSPQVELGAKSAVDIILKEIAQ